LAIANWQFENIRVGEKPIEGFGYQSSRGCEAELLHVVWREWQWLPHWKPDPRITKSKTDN